MTRRSRVAGGVIDRADRTAAGRGALAAFAVIALLLGSGCSSYHVKALKVREPLAMGDFAGAAAWLENEKPGGDGLPYLMELGLVLRQNGEFDRSNEAFEAAEVLVDELWTKSVSKEILALATSDETIPYGGEAWERVLVNFYRALNYVDLGRYEDALVECRKINQKLRVYADATDESTTYQTDAFAQYLTAMLFEAGGDLNDAWVSLRLADEAYTHYAEAYGVGPPESLRRDLVRVAETLGEADAAARYRKRWPDLEVPSPQEVLAKGEVVLFWEEGFAPAKDQADIMIPILKRERDHEHASLAWTLRDRYYHPIHYERRELSYLLRLALPTYPPAGARDRPGRAVLSVVGGGPAAETEVAEDVGAIARRGLDDRMGGILFKTALRALGKYALTELAEEKKGEFFGTLVNLLTAATEKADTRAWITLPRTIQVARLLLEPGTYTLRLDCHRGGDGGKDETITFEDVEVGAGEVRFLNHRTF